MQIKSNQLTINVELSRKTVLGDSYLSTVFSAAGEELASFEIIVHRHGGAYMGRQLSGRRAPVGATKFVHEQVASALNEPVAF